MPYDLELLPLRDVQIYDEKRRAKELRHSERRFAIFLLSKLDSSQAQTELAALTVLGFCEVHHAVVFYTQDPTLGLAAKSIVK